jgi:SAM-dependent methyltransferase
MLGATLDYLILRTLAHRRNRATEEQLDSLSERASPAALEEAGSKFAKLVERFEGHLPIDPRLRYLDVGCGSGELTLAFASRGIGRITGVDVLPRNIESARACARRAGVGEGVQFVCRDFYEWTPEGKYDVLLSFDALEHIEAPAAFLARMADLLAPGGVAVLAFGPLFHSPFGDHMWDFFRVQIPWRGVLFSEKALLRVRRECFRPTDPADSYRKIAGGLNLIRYSDFLKHVSDTGWTFDYLRVNAFLDAPPLRLASSLFMRVPALRDYLVHNVYAVLRRAA